MIVLSVRMDQKEENSMRFQNRIFKTTVFAVVCVAGLLLPAFAQPPAFDSGQLDNLVARIALYPDPLLAQVLAAATFPDQIQPAAGWADQHHYLTGDALAAA